MLSRIRNNQLTASSTFNANHAPFLARLNHKAKRGKAGAWCALHNDYEQWLQVDFGGPSKIVMMQIQGRDDKDQWVKYFYLYYALDGVRFNPMRWTTGGIRVSK
jgi:hypothetical protein